MRENKYVRNKTIRVAFEMLSAWEEEQLDIDSTQEIHCSEEYTRNMEKLIRAQKRPLWNYTNTVGKKVAVVALITLMTLGASMSVSAVRESVVEFVVNVYERFVEIFFEEEDVAEAPCELDTIYTLGTLPEGYELVENGFYNGKSINVFKDKNDNKIIFSQNVLRGAVTLDYEQSNYIILNRNGINILYIEKLGSKFFEWNSFEYKFSLSVPESFSLDDCIALIDSLIFIDDIE